MLNRKIRKGCLSYFTIEERLDHFGNVTVVVVYQRESITSQLETSKYQWWLYLKENKFKNLRHVKDNTETSFCNGEVTLNQNLKLFMTWC